MLLCNACLIRCLRLAGADVRSARHASASSPFMRPKSFQLRSPTTRNESRRQASVATYKPRQGGTTKDAVIYRKDVSIGRAKAEPDINPRHLARELQYIRDPLQMADHIRNTLRRESWGKAHELLKIASKNMSCTVGWNHLLDFLMKQGRLKTTLKLYNDMKKRAQRPDSYTYLIMLRGFAMHPSHPSSVSEAVKLYHSMRAPNSRVAPSIIHTNAVLNVASQAGDMDALWAIAGAIPEHGANAADYTTYSTVLSALKLQAQIQESADISDEQRAGKLHELLRDGRQIWVEVIDRWRQGVLFLDERLVCTMGRLLLKGNQRADWDDVFSLAQQTMKIPRLIPRYGSLDDSQPLRRIGSSEDASMNSHFQDPKSDSTSVSATAPTESTGTANHDEFSPVDLPERPASKEGKSSTYVHPSSNTLSLLLEACGRLESKRLARQYWDLLTTDLRFKVLPDLDNFHMLLRLLRRSRSSADALEIMRTQMASVPLARKTFRIAMSACVRDKNNMHVMSNASAMVDIMFERLPFPDIQTLARYMELAQHASESKDVLDALERVGRGERFDLQKLLSSSSGVVEADPADEEANTAEAREAAVQLAQGIVACCDRLLTRGDVTASEKSALAQQRNHLTALASQHLLRERSLKRQKVVKRSQADESKTHIGPVYVENTRKEGKSVAWTQNEVR